MSSLRLGFSGVVLAGVLIGSSYVVASAVPLRARASRTQEAAPKRVPKVVTAIKPDYPAGMKEYGISAEVMVKVDISAAGTVTSAKVSAFTMMVPGTASKEAVRAAGALFWEAAEAATRQWKFEPGESDATADVEFTFTTKSDKDVQGGVAGGVAGGVLGGVAGGVPGGVPGGVAGSARPGEPPRQPSSTPLHVGGAVKPPHKLIDVSPVYPDDAKAAGVRGVVIIEATIAKDGSVSNARILRSVPMLDQAALDAVNQWIFEPTLLHGAPIEVVMTLTVNFGAQ